MSDTPLQHEQETLNGPTVTEGGEKEVAEATTAAIEAPASAAVGKTVHQTNRAEREQENEVGEVVERKEGEPVASAEEAQGQANTDSSRDAADTNQIPQDASRADEHGDEQGPQGSEPTVVTTNEDSQGPADASIAAPSPSLTNTSLRPPSPSSRTSTPPLAGTIAPTAKKFSAMNVNKKFLSKTGSTPSPSNASSATKLGLLSSRLPLHVH